MCCVRRAASTHVRARIQSPVQSRRNYGASRTHSQGRARRRAGGSDNPSQPAGPMAATSSDPALARRSLDRRATSVRRLDAATTLLRDNCAINSPGVSVTRIAEQNLPGGNRPVTRCDHHRTRHLTNGRPRVSDLRSSQQHRCRGRGVVHLPTRAGLANHQRRPTAGRHGGAAVHGLRQLLHHLSRACVDRMRHETTPAEDRRTSNGSSAKALADRALAEANRQPWLRRCIAPLRFGRAERRGDVFAGYRIVRQLGAGGMREVYLAQHPRLSRQDAIKIRPAEVTADRDFASASAARRT